MITSVTVDTIDAVYYTRKDREGTLWTISNDDDVISVATPKKQIIFGDIVVGLAATRVGTRVSVGKDIVREINRKYADYVNKMSA